MVFGKELIIAIVFALGLSAAGAWQLHEERTGPKAVATVTDCSTSHGTRTSSTTCHGSWVAGGSLLGGGHVVLGVVHGAGDGDVDKLVNVRLHGDDAYMPSDRLPFVFFGLGLAFLALGAYAARKRSTSQT